MKKTSVIARIAIIAAIYAVATLAFPVLSYGAIQLRISEALCLLPLILPEAVAGLTVGCFLANTVGVFLGFSLPWDIVIGTLATFLATGTTRKIRSKWLAPLPTVFFNAIMVGTMLTYIMMPEAESAPLIYNIATVGIGEAIVCYAIGIPIFSVLEKVFKK